MIGREKLAALKKAARRKTAGMELPIETMHALIDSNLEALEIIDGGTTLANRNKEMRLGLAELRSEVEKLAQTATDSMHPEFGPRALFILDLVAGMLTTDYRRYGTWADIRPQIDEEFGDE